MLYTTVIGVDAGHLEQLRITWPTWADNKPSLLKNPVVCFYDVNGVSPAEIHYAIDPKPVDLILYAWPPPDAIYGSPDAPVDKWHNPQRELMLSGFVYVPARAVQTSYWLKLDLDVVANGHDDWIDPSWFNGDPAIVSHRWSYSKPPMQMMDLDAWVEKHKDKLPAWQQTAPLNLIPKPGSNLVKHDRIISWCAFFDTKFTNLCAVAAEQTCGFGKLPVPSQDGFLWYSATRLGLPIRTVNMKRRGFTHCNGNANVRKAAELALDPVKLV